MREIKRVIEFLRNKLRYWEYLYYIKSNPEISDDEYDQHLETLRILETKYPDLLTVDSPTQCIGGGMVQNQFLQIQHIIPMLSLDNVFDECALLNFDERIRNKLNYKKNQEILYCCELKIDGVGISLVYKDGALIHAATRGDGLIGEDVTENVRTIRSIPLLLKKDNLFPDFLEIRGEVFIPNDCFLKLNQSLIRKGVSIFSNPRNAASGSLRQSNSFVTSKRFLDFFCYNISFFMLNNGIQKLSDSHWKRLQTCNMWGIPIVRDYTYVCVGIENVVEYFKKVQNIRSSLNFNIDGIVIKVDSISLQKKLGYSSRAPRWAVSYKFPAKKFLSVVHDVRFQVNRTGILIPVATIQPITVAGVTIKSVSLHNIGVMRRLGLMLGDSVIIERVGDVIPQILQVQFSDRLFNKVAPIIYPSYCPVCKSVLVEIIFKKTVVLRCSSGWYCFAQRKGMLKHFASRKAMNIVGMGDKVIDRLITFGLLSTPVDFFHLNIDNLSSVDGIQRRLAYRLLNAINISKKTTFSRFIYALGIPNVGKVKSIILEKKYSGNINHLIISDIDSLLTIQDIGLVAAHNIFTFFRNDFNLNIVNKLLSPEIGIRWKFD